MTDEDQPDDTTGAPPPKIIVATEPAELILSDGAPDWTPIQGMSLLYLSNSDSHVFLDINSQDYYVLLSGRWFKGESVDEEWQWNHVPNDDLPEGFSDIQPESPNGDVLTHVSGTVQAREAVLDSTIPQTAAVKREDASFEVEYDGKPKFEKMEDADKELRVAVNTSKSVFKVGKLHYACEEGIWYVSDSPTGPWKVATEIPEAIYSIPTSDPFRSGS